jgi:hypothetical protein
MEDVELFYVNALNTDVTNQQNIYSDYHYITVRPGTHKNLIFNFGTVTT